MKQISCKIQIGQYVFNNVSGVQIESSYENFTDVATITVARKLRFEGKTLSGDSGIFKRGDAVTISLGYNFSNQELFTGYLTDIKPGSPLEFRCEDEMFQLKKNPVSKSYRKTDLKTLLADILPGYKIVSVDADLGKFRIVKATAAQILDEIKKTYGIRSWFRGKTLYCGLSYWPELQNPVNPEFAFQRDIIVHDLAYQSADQMKIKVHAVSMMPNNTKVEIDVGDPDGETRTLTYYNKSKDELKAAAERDLANFRFDGFRGSFTTFGTPVTRHGDKVNIIDPIISDRNGTYIAKKVTTTFGTGGYRQAIELDVKV